MNNNDVKISAVAHAAHIETTRLLSELPRSQTPNEPLTVRFAVTYSPSDPSSVWCSEVKTKGVVCDDVHELVRLACTNTKRMLQSPTLYFKVVFVIVMNKGRIPTPNNWERINE